MRLGIIVPSNNPTAFMMDFLPTCQYLVGEEHEVHILLAAQHPWMEHQLDTVWEYARRNLGLDLSYVRLTAESPPRMCFLRQQAALLDSSPDVYMLADDNLKLTPDALEVLDDIEDYFEFHSACGLIQCHRKPHKTLGTCITATDNGLITTNKGLFIRNAAMIDGGGLWEQDTMRLKASLEETIAGYRVLEEGFFPARYYGCKFEHEIHKIGADEGLHSRALIAENGERYVQRRYNDNNWFHESNAFPYRLARMLMGDALLIREGDMHYTKLLRGS